MIISSVSVVFSPKAACEIEVVRWLLCTGVMDLPCRGQVNVSKVHINTENTHVQMPRMEHPQIVPVQQPQVRNSYKSFMLWLVFCRPVT